MANSKNTPAKSKHNLSKAQKQSRKKRKFRSTLHYSEEYIAYVQNGTSAAVFITRDIAAGVPTQGKWIDVLRADGRKNEDGMWMFPVITVALFPRKTKPDYRNAVTLEDKHYLTWVTATKDIQKARMRGETGILYRIYPDLVRNPNLKYRSVTKYYSVSGEEISEETAKEWDLRYPDYRQYRTETVQELVPHQKLWIYQINGVERIGDEKI